MTREIIFDIPNQSEYRVVCKFNASQDMRYVWWGYLQRKTPYKKYIWFGEVKYKWVEIKRCWWSTNIDSLDKLKKLALNLFYYEFTIYEELVEKAMNLK